METDTPIGEKQVLIGTVLRGPTRTDPGDGNNGRTVFRLALDTGFQERVCAYDQDFPPGHLQDIKAAQRLRVVARSYRCAGVLDEFHATSLELRED